MRKLLILTTAALALVACSPKTKTDTSQSATTEEAQQNQDAALSKWFEDNFNSTIRRYPQTLASLGIKERMSEWNDPSRAFAIEEIAHERDLLKELQASFDRSKLSESMQLSYDLFVRQMENSIEDDKWWGYNYSFNQMFGAQSGIPTFLKNQHPISNVEEARAYIDRLNGVEKYLGTIVENSQKSADRGIMPPKFVFDYVISDARNILKGAPFEENSADLNLFAQDFKEKVDKLNLDAETQKALYEDAIKALLTSVGPAYNNLITVMKSQQAKATTDDGVWKLPKGEEFYTHRLKRITTTDLSASEIHELGLAEVARIHLEMQGIMDKVGFKGSLQDFFKFLKTDPQFVYEESDAGRDAYLAEADHLLDVMKSRLNEVFLHIPKAPLEVRRVEPFREKSAGKAFYNRPSPDGSRPGIFYANLYKVSDMPKYQMEALVYHEGLPGHHMQIATATELQGVPSFQKFGSVTAYSEGWGLYSELLPKEMGFYQDPYSDFGRLSMEIWRAARLVVDTGLHDKKWTREQAIDYLVQNTPNPKNDCVKAIERYIVMPGQATAYKIGMIKIVELRENAKTKLGDKFDIREFHDVVLRNGPLPLNILEDEIDDWVSSKSN